MATLAEALRGYTPPTTSALGDPIVEHFRNLPQTTAQNAINTNNMVQNSFPYDFDPKQPMLTANPNYDPQAAKDFANYIPNLMGATAFHGTPHKILGKFDISKMGTGEGAQAYGPGMYFAESKDLADVYRKKLTNEAGNPVKNPNDSIQLQMGNLENQIKQLKQSNDPNAKSMIKAYQNRIDEINKAGNLYKVDIPDEYIPNMLDWDKPFANQSKEVKEILKSSGLYKKYKDNLSDFSSPMSTRNKNARGENIQAFVEHIAGSPEKAAQMLDELGIKGIRYLDEISRAKGKGTSNFVVFEPSTVKILEENGKPLTRKELIEQQVNKVLE
jgi:hypothetical protein